LGSPWSVGGSGSGLPSKSKALPESGRSGIARWRSTGAPCPPTAQFSVRQAEVAARNIAAAQRGEAPVPFAHVSRGAMAAIGHLSGVGRVGGIQVTGLIAWLMWRAYYPMQTPTLARKLRLFGERSWRMLFPTDITHLHFARSIDLAPLDSGGGASSSPPAWSSQP
jgi:NADH:ubiquinone reductase (H+-translocating)